MKLAAISFLALAVTGAQAVERPRRAIPAAPPAPKCEPMCANDYAPCDPIYFKVADRRCSDRRTGSNR